MKKLLLGGIGLAVGLCACAAPIQKAARNGEDEAVKELLTGGADIEAPSSQGLTPLIWAAYFGRDPNTDSRMALATMQCASLLREALWSLVSEMYLGAPGADYDDYARRNFERFDAALAAYRARFNRG